MHNVDIHCKNLFECPVSNIEKATLTFAVQIYVNVNISNIGAKRRHSLYKPIGMCNIQYRKSNIVNRCTNLCECQVVQYQTNYPTLLQPTLLSIANVHNC